jgi:hypothetical protein
MQNQIQHRHLLWTSLIFYLGCILFIGSTLFFGFGVAPSLFQNIPSRDIAGFVNRTILDKLIIIQATGLTFTLLGLLISLRYFSTFWHQFVHVLFTLTAVLFIVYAFGINHQMQSLVSQIHSFDYPKQSDLALIELFRTYHKWYSGLVSASIFTALSTFVWQTFNLTQLATKTVITKA